MHLHRYNLYEQDDIDDFDVIDDFIEDEEFIAEDGLLEQLEIISEKLSISGRLDRNDNNKYVYSISSRLKLIVEFEDGEIVDMYVDIRKSKASDESSYIDCMDDTTELSNMSDYLNTATMLVKEIEDKLM